MGDFDTALASLNKCKDMSRHIHNLRLNLDSLICISNIKHRMKNTNEESVAEEKVIFQEALNYAKDLGDKKYELNCIASLGILDGQKQFESFKGMFDQKMSFEQSQLRESRVIDKLRQEESKNIKIESVKEEEDTEENEVIKEVSDESKKQENSKEKEGERSVKKSVKEELPDSDAEEGESHNQE